uniref:Uncharacterized protein n=1 Tax=Romanomermis culicivorax TaxID=13658 RepID=A0A915I9Y4_ROMCU
MTISFRAFFPARSRGVNVYRLHLLSDGIVGCPHRAVTLRESNMTLISNGSPLKRKAGESSQLRSETSHSSRVCQG